MTRPPDPRWDPKDQRNARIRRMREERQGGAPRRRFQPVVLLAWFIGLLVQIGALVNLLLVVAAVLLVVQLINEREARP